MFGRLERGLVFDFVCNIGMQNEVCYGEGHERLSFDSSE